MFRRFLLISTIGLLFFARPTFAHYEMSDNGISIELHVEPDDDPIAGESTPLYLYFTDRNNRLTNTNCSCNVAIYLGNSRVFSSPISILDGSDHKFKAHVLFPYPGIYKVEVTGEIEASKKTTFNTTYDLRVEKGSLIENTSSIRSRNNTYILPLIGLLAVVVVSFFMLISKRSHKK